MIKELKGKKRILIVGCCGAGKTTLALRLGSELNLPVHHLDRLWWLPGWVEKPRERFDAELAEILKQERWILDGNYLRTLGERLKFADCVLVLDFPRRTCLRQLFLRRLTYRPGSRPDMGEGCRERLNLPFLKYVWNYRKATLPRVLGKIFESGLPARIFHSPRELEIWIGQSGTGEEQSDGSAPIIP